MNINSILFILNTVLNIPLSFIAIVGNALVLVSLVRTPTFLSPSNVLLLSLALTDLGVGLVVQPCYITWKIRQFADCDSTSVIWIHYYASGYLCSVSFVNVTLLSVDRFLALHLHLRYKELVTVKRTVSFVAVVWVMGAVVIASGHQLPYPVVNNIKASLVLAGQVLNVTLYYNIYVIVRSHRRQVDSQILGRVNTEGRNVTRARRSLINTFRLYLLFLACYLPLTVMSGLTSKINQSVLEISLTIVYLNSVLNPLFISRKIPEIRSAIVKYCGEGKTTVGSWLEGNTPLYSSVDDSLLQPQTFTSGRQK